MLAHVGYSLYSTTAWNMPSKLPLTLGGSEPPPNAWFLRPTQVHAPNGIASGSPVSEQLMVMTSKRTDQGNIGNKRQAASSHSVHVMPHNNTEHKLPCNAEEKEDIWYACKQAYNEFWIWPNAIYSMYVTKQKKTQKRKETAANGLSVKSMKVNPKTGNRHIYRVPVSTASYPQIHLKQLYSHSFSVSIIKLRL